MRQSAGHGKLLLTVVALLAFGGTSFSPHRTVVFKTYRCGGQDSGLLAALNMSIAFMLLVSH